MSLALHPTNPLVWIWGSHREAMTAPHNAYPPSRPVCSVCGYELIAGWCSSCDLEQNGVLV
jgi:hypothetical protein